ncbi:hypothetical protein QML37_30530, partial [Klebsiella pneumoniae]|uniref:hypothetical protein n=1 Tax=Klebsiella pneumoniae TaxID=573 RepID=UPI003A7F9F55
MQDQGNPNLKISPITLDGTNYLIWSRSVTRFLNAKSKLDLVNGSSQPPPLDDPSYKEWLSNNDVVASWLINSMDSKIASNFTFLESAEEIWNAAKDLYGEQFNIARMFQLSQMKGSFKKGNLAISEYIGQFKSVWDELDLFNPLTMDLVIAKRQREQERIFELLAGLPHDFETLRGQILMSNELPSLTSVLSTLMREESR